MRAAGAGRAGGKRDYRGLSDHAPHDESGIGEDLRGHTRHTHADHWASCNGYRGVLGGISLALQVFKGHGFSRADRAYKSDRASATEGWSPGSVVKGE